MRSLAARIRRALTALIPGSVANIAAQKRNAEKELRAAGLSRSHARAIVAERFHNRG